MKKNYTTVLVLFFVIFIAFENASAQTFHASYNYRKKITLNTNSNISGASDLTNFTIYLELSDTDLKSTANGGKVQSSKASVLASSGDIAFLAVSSTQTSANELSYQVESYDEVNGTLKVWIKIPTLTKTDYVLNLYYGSSSFAAHPTSATAWASDYKAVFHFNETTSPVNTGTGGVGTTASIVNAVGTSNSASTPYATPYNMTSANVVAGKTGNAYSFNGTNQKIVGTNAVNITGPFTVSAWVKTNSTTADQKIVNNHNSSYKGYKLGFYGGKLELESNGAANSTIRGVAGGTAYSTGTWYYVQGVYDGTSLSTYINGVLDRTITGVAPSAGGLLYIGVAGESNGTNYFFNGVMDEVRVSNVAKTSDWLLTEYTNQNSPAGFVNTIAALETNSAPATPSDVNASANTVAENSAIGTLVQITASSSDPDGNTMTYSLTNSAGGRFTINSSTGVVSVADGTLLDYETANSYTITVQASDGLLTSTQTFNISITDVNEAPVAPTDANSSANSIAENASAGSTVGITAFSTDPESAAISYSLSSSGGGLFSINSSTGIVTYIGSGLNYEAATSHSITVVASDGSLTSSQSFTISVTDVNEAPVISSSASILVPKNNTALSNTIVAADPEGQTVTYSITGGADQEKFTVSGSGVLSFVSPPDYSSPTDADGNNTYIVAVSASDGVLSDTRTFTLTISGTDNAYYTTYPFKKVLTVNNTSIGITTNQTGFPALLRIQDDALIINGTYTDIVNSATSPNFAFVDAGDFTTELNYEVENYNSTTGTLLVWVKIPTLYASTTNLIHFYFGGSTTLTTHNAAFTKATWSNVTSGAKSFKGVWHFNESTSNTAPQFTDATTNGNSLTKSASGVTQNASSVIGNGITLSSGTASKTSASSIPANNSSYSVALWAYYASNPSGSANMVSIQNASASSATQLGYNSVAANIATWRWGNSGSIMARATTLPSAATWHYYVYSYNGTTSSLYVDGVLVNSSSALSPQSGTPNAVVFGAYFTTSNVAGGENFNGSIDEAQIIDAALSADWIKACYFNQRAASTFSTNGAIEGNSTTALANSGYLRYTWNGSLSQVAGNTSNWTNTTPWISTTPVLSNKATWIIPSGLSNYPVLDASYTINGLSVASGASLNLNGNTLNVAADIVNAGQITYNSSNNSKLVFNGSSATQSYTGNSTSNSCQVGQLEINNSAAGTITLSGGNVNVYNLVTVSGGYLNSNGYLTLKSNAVQSAGVAPLSGSNRITGNVNVESYFTGGTSAYRSTRVISPPIDESSLSTKVFAQLKNYIIITGPGGANNGFDPGSNVQPYAVTLTKYNEPATLSQSQFTTVANITESLLPGTAAFLYYRGNRDGYTTGTASTSNKVNAPFATPENTTVTYTGPINQGNITVNLSYTANSGDTRNGYNLIGNPYPATINWDNVTRTNVANELKIIKPGGGYATYLNTGSGGISTNAGGLDLNYIQPGQGFYTRATSTGASVTFTENSKSVSATPVRLLYKNNDQLLSFSGEESRKSTLKTSSSSKIDQLRISLQDSLNTEEAVTVFQSGNSANAGTEDALFFSGSSISLSTLSSDDVKLTINFMPDLSQVNELKLSIGSSSSSNLKLSFTDLSAVKNSEIYLQDNFTGTLTDIKANPVYNFTINNSNSATVGNSRFKLLFSPISTLPVVLTNFTATKQASGVILKWKAAADIKTDRFELERSDNGKIFSTIGTVDPKSSSAGSSYSFTDESPVWGLNYYRIKIIDSDGKFSYSSISLVKVDDGSGFSFYPNPATDKIVFSGKNIHGSILIRIKDLLGREVKKTWFEEGQALQENIQGLIPGIYFIEAVDSYGNVLGKLKLVKE